MGWEIQNGRQYFYETVYRDGKRVRICHGFSIEAMRAAERIEKERKAREEDIALIRALKAQDDLIDQRVAQLDACIKMAIAKAGLHYTRGQYRKKRTFKRFKMSEQAQTKDTSVITLDPRPEQEITPEQVEAEGGEIRRIALEALRGLKPLRDKGKNDDPIIQYTCNVDATIDEIVHKVAVMRKDLQYEYANPIDQMVIEQVLTAWVQWYVSGWLLEGELIPNRTWRQNQYFFNRYQTCQAKLTRAIDQLAKIRQISPSLLHITTPEDIAARKLRIEQERVEYEEQLKQWELEAEEELRREQEEDED